VVKSIGCQVSSSACLFDDDHWIFALVEWRIAVALLRGRVVVPLHLDGCVVVVFVAIGMGVATGGRSGRSGGCGGFVTILSTTPEFKSSVFDEILNEVHLLG